MDERFGPLAALAGEWEGDEGLDVSFHNADSKVGDTPYREVISFKPFGPVDNGPQQLYGLDYRMAAWRIGEPDPFHTEVGYWLWDAGLGHVMRCFVIPRACTIMAGGEVSANASSFTLRATVGDERYGICSNPYLADVARCVSCELTVSVNGNEFTYEEDSVIEHKLRPGELLHHTDRNTLKKTAEIAFPPVVK